MKLPRKTEAFPPSFLSFMTYGVVGAFLSVVVGAGLMRLIDFITAGGIATPMGLHKVIPYLSDVRERSVACGQADLANLIELLWLIAVLLPLMISVVGIYNASGYTALQKNMKDSRLYRGLTYALTLILAFVVFPTGLWGVPGAEINPDCTELRATLLGDQERLLFLSALFWMFFGNTIDFIVKRAPAAS